MSSKTIIKVNDLLSVWPDMFEVTIASPPLVTAWVTHELQTWGATDRKGCAANQLSKDDDNGSLLAQSIPIEYQIIRFGA